MFLHFVHFMIEPDLQTGNGNKGGIIMKETKLFQINSYNETFPTHNSKILTSFKLEKIFAAAKRPSEMSMGSQVSHCSRAKWAAGLPLRISS